MLSLQMQFQDLIILDQSLKIEHIEHALETLLEAYQNDVNNLHAMYIERLEEYERRSKERELELCNYKKAHEYLLCLHNE